jgi:hypothetical protein
MYIESEYKKLFYVTLAKFLLEIGIMVGFFGISSFAIPAALVIGKFFTSFAIFIVLVRKRKEIFNIPAFIKINILLIILSVSIGIANNYIIDILLPKSIWEIIAIYTPFVVLSAIGIFYYLNRNYGVEFKKYFLKKSV